MTSEFYCWKCNTRMTVKTGAMIVIEEGDKPIRHQEALICNDCIHLAQEIIRKWLEKDKK